MDVAAVRSIINQPWVRDGRNCWRLAREVVATFGVELPVVLDVAPAGRAGAAEKASLFATHAERARWRAPEGLGEWALTLMYRPHRKSQAIEHCGVYLNMDGGGVLHTDDPHGVVFDTLGELSALRNWKPIFLVPIL